MNDTEKIQKSETDWQKELTPEQYHVMREKGTETPFTGIYVSEHQRGMYKCAACGAELFSSETKFDSGTGWPSFWAPISDDRVELVPDRSGGMLRTEVKCRSCGAHLGHLFDDGPEPTGQRFCLNSISLKLAKKE